MSTIRKQIHDRVVARLQSALPSGVGLLISPRADVPVDQLPAVLLFSRNDRPLNERDNMTIPHQRVYTLQTEIRVGTREEEDATDDLAVAIRQALLQDETAGGLLPDTALDGLALRVTWSDQLWDGVEMESPLSASRLEFNVYYIWQPGN